MVGNKFRWNAYDSDNLVCAFDMSTINPATGKMKNLARTGSVFDATINGALVLANPLIKCKKTKCMDFDGATNYLSLANPITSLTTFTIIYWITQDVTAGIHFSRASAANTFIYFNAGPQLVAFVAGAGPVTTPRYPVAAPYMICVTRDATPIGKVYINGKFIAQAATGATPADANAYIGQYWDGTARFNCRLDNMLFYNVALDASQISSIYRSANPRL